jgi:hypothetical protein
MSHFKKHQRDDPIPPVPAMVWGLLPLAGALLLAGRQVLYIRANR